MDLEYILLDSMVMHVRLYLSVPLHVRPYDIISSLWINQKECLVPPLLRNTGRSCLVDEELIQSRHEEELDNGHPERHFYASPTMMSGDSEEGDLGDTTTSLLDESLQSD